MSAELPSLRLFGYQYLNTENIIYLIGIFGRFQSVFSKIIIVFKKMENWQLCICVLPINTLSSSHFYFFRYISIKYRENQSRKFLKMQKTFLMTTATLNNFKSVDI